MVIVGLVIQPLKSLTPLHVYMLNCHNEIHFATCNFQVMSVDNGYVLEECLPKNLINSGAFTKVYRLQVENNARKFAVKFLDNEVLHQLDQEKQEELRAKFSSQCEIILNLNLNHGNIVQQESTLSDMNNGCGWIMELMDMSLTAYLSNQTQELLPISIQIGLSHDVAQALAYLHQNGLVHQKLTRNSVFLTLLPTPVAKVGDFESCAYMQSAMVDIVSFGKLVAEIMSMQYVSDEQQIYSIINSPLYVDHPLVPIVQYCLPSTCTPEDHPSAAILVTSISKQAIAYTCKQEAIIQNLRAQSFQVQSQNLVSAPELLQRSCDAVIDSTRNIVYLRQGKDRKLFVFSLNHNVWEEGPECNLLQCALVLFQGKLLAIGGTETDKSKRRREVFMLVEDTQSAKWEDTLRPIQIARGRSTALACDFKNSKLLVVAGGEKLKRDDDPNSGYESLSNVEVLTEQGWQLASALPGTLCCASGTVVKDNVCLLGGWSERDNELTSVYTCQLKDLIGTLNAPFTQVWSEVKTPCPVALTTCTTFHDKLLIVGGTIPGDLKKTPVDTIYVYNEHTNNWDIVGRLPAPRYLSYVQAICKCRFIVITGCKDSSSASDDVYIFELK